MRLYAATSAVLPINFWRVIIPSFEGPPFSIAKQTSLSIALPGNDRTSYDETLIHLL